MNFDLQACTFENLNNLKFNELQKLSSHFHVNKRWAKKREIIEKLLLLRDREMENKQLPSTSEKSAVPEENIQWLDANKAFQTLEPDRKSDGSSRRLTYNVTKSDAESSDRRLTYNVNKEDNLISSGTTSSEIDRRLTYNADDLKCSIKDLQVVSEAINIEKESGKCEKPHLTHDINSTEVESNNLKNNEIQMEKNENNTSSNNERNKYPKAKMLTIPFTGGLTLNTRTRVKDASKSLEKCFISKTPSIKPITSHTNGSEIKNISMSNSLQSEEKFLGSETVEHEIKQFEQNKKRNVLPRRKSKTEDNVLVKNLTPSRNLKFYSPNENDKNTKRFSQPSHALDLHMNNKSRIPKAKSTAQTQKVISATKMPNFSKIHQRRFEQMDSLIDYKRKKEERAKKLFGISQPGIPSKISKGDVSKVFQFRSSNSGKENESNKATVTSDKVIAKPIKGEKTELNRTRSTLIKRDSINNKGSTSKEKLNKKDILSRAGSNPDILNNLKEQNRRLIHGVRTNKRFELQMKFRQL